MPSYKYNARNINGKKVSGKKEATDEKQLKIILKKEKLILIKAKEIKSNEHRTTQRFKIVKTKDIAVLTREIGAMLDGGISLLRAITILSTQDKKAPIKKVLVKVKEDLTVGYPFSYALARHPQYFNDLFISMVKSGEASGGLDQVMNKLADSLEKSEEIKAKVKGALIYPTVVFTLTLAVVLNTTVGYINAPFTTVVFTLTLAVVFLLVAFILPTFVEIFEDTGAEIPLLTSIVIKISLFCNKYWYIIIFGTIGFVMFITKSLKTKKGKRIWHIIQLKLPLFGPVIKKSIFARFTRVLSTLLESGVPILEAFVIVSQAVDNTVIGNAILKVKGEIESGETIAKPLEKTKIFPAMVVNMIDVGEESGHLVEMLKKVADFNERELEQAIRDMLAMFEPIIILFLGITVGILVVAMYLPIFGLADAIA